MSNLSEAAPRRKGFKVDLLTKLLTIRAIADDLAKIDDGSKLPALAVAVQLIITHHNAKTGRCDPGYDTLAEEIGTSVSTVDRAVKLLKRRRWVTAKQRRNISASFTINWRSGNVTGDRCRVQDLAPVTDPDLAPVTPPDLAPVTYKRGEREQGEKEQGEKEQGEKEQGEKEQGEKEQGESIYRRHDSNGRHFFEEFYRAFPKKREKLAAEKAFRRAVDNGTDPQEIVLGAMRYAAERTGQDPKYTKYPATWLNRGCWEDEPSPQAPRQRNSGVANLLAIAGGRND